MPSTVIEICREYNEAEEVALIDAVQQSLITAFRIPPRDRHIRLLVHRPHRMQLPPDLADPSRYTIVTIDCFAGRSVDAKRELYRQIVARLEPLGVPADHISIVVRDLPQENWGIRGGHAACDIDLGFTVTV